MAAGGGGGRTRLTPPPFHHVAVGWGCWMGDQHGRSKEAWLTSTWSDCVPSEPNISETITATATTEHTAAKRCACPASMRPALSQWARLQNSGHIHGTYVAVRIPMVWVLGVPWWVPPKARQNVLITSQLLRGDVEREQLGLDRQLTDTAGMPGRSCRRGGRGSRTGQRRKRAYEHADPGQALREAGRGGGNLC